MSVDAAAVAPPLAAPRRARRRNVNGLLITGIFLMTFVILIGVVGPFIVDIEWAKTGAVTPTQPPSAEHWLGADAFGRDILSRLIFGARTALSIGFLSAFFGCSIGALVGIVSAFAGGKIDILIQRIIDIMLSFPIIILAIVVIASPIWSARSTS